MTPRLFVALLLIGILLSACKKESESVVEPEPPNYYPKVLQTRPPMNSQGPYAEFTSIFIQFSRPMNLGSLRQAISLSAPGSALCIDTSQVYDVGASWYSAALADSTDSLFSRGWPIGRVYTLRISSAAVDTSGIPLKPAFAMTFEPEPSFRIISISPVNGSTGFVSIRNNAVSIYFNNTIDASIFAFVSLSPQPDGVWSIRRDRTVSFDSSVVVFTPKLVEEQTQYRVMVDANAHDIRGNALSAAFTSSFTTAEFRVFETYPSNSMLDASIYPPTIRIAFTYPVDTISLASSFTIQPFVRGTFWSGGQETAFTADSGYFGKSQYVVTLSDNLKSISGTKLPSTYQFAFTTEDFHVTSTKPYNGQIPVSRVKPVEIEVNFNTVIDASSVDSAFRISPPAYGSFTFCTSDCTPTWFHYTALLAPDTTYTVSVSTAMRSKMGDQLSRSHVFSFTTGD